jgi:hypothetical protein
MWYDKVMANRNPQLNWERLLDGGTYTLKLDEIGWQRGLNDLRAKVHYEADRRRGIAHTHKKDAWTLEIWAEQCRVKLTAGTCTCGTPPWEGHIITCAKIQRPDLRQAPTPPPQWPTTRPALQQQEQPPTPAPPQAPWEPDPTSDEDYEPLTPEEEEALLGPCTCGQAPVCLPTCARAGG